VIYVQGEADEVLNDEAVDTEVHGKIYHFVHKTLSLYCIHNMV